MSRFDPYSFHDDIGGPVAVDGVAVLSTLSAGVLIILALLICIGVQGNSWLGS